MVNDPRNVFIIFSSSRYVTRITRTLRNFRRLIIVPLVRTSEQFIRSMRSTSRAQASLNHRTSSLNFTTERNPNHPQRDRVVRTSNLRRVRTNLSFLRGLFTGRLLLFHRFRTVRRKGRVTSERVHRFDSIRTTCLSNRHFITRTHTVTNQAKLSNRRLSRLITRRVQ